MTQLIINISSAFQDILLDAKDNNMTSPAQLPYFEGDFWPNVLEVSIMEFDQEEEEKRKWEEAEAAEAEEPTGEPPDTVEVSTGSMYTIFHYNLL